LLAAYFVALDRRWPLQTRAQALRVGSGWLALSATDVEVEHAVRLPNGT
jgi:hypothetical protein